MITPRIALAHVAALTVVVLGSATAIAAQTQTTSVIPALTALPGSTLTIRGSTTIGAKWHCSTDDVISRAEIRPVSGGAVEALRQVTVSVRVWDLRCQSGPMERAMRRAMRAEHDSTAVILGQFASAGSGDSAAHLDGSLNVAGVQRAVWVDATVADQIDGTLRVRTSVPLLLSSFAITPPRVLFGAVRARDAILVDVDLRFPAFGNVADTGARKPRD